MMKQKRLLQEGFTLIEMLVIAPIVVLAIGAFLTVIISMTGEVLASRAANNMTFNIQDALNRIDQDTKLSAGFLATNSISLSSGDKQGYDDAAASFTNVGGSSGTSLILNVPVTNGNPTVLTTGLVYLANKPNACGDSRVQDNTPMTMNIVYFVKNNTLWRRTIMPSNYNAGISVSCSTPWQQPSCSPGITGGLCVTNDIKLIEGVTPSHFIVQYFTSAAATSANPTASDTATATVARGTALQGLSTVNVSIKSVQTVAGRDVERSANIRSTRLDTNASAIANYTPPTTPSAPTLSGSSSATDPTRVVYNWPKVNGAENYTFQYNIDGGAWQTPVTNQNVNTYTVLAPYNKMTVNARVTATNTAGTSAQSAIATVSVPLWGTPTLVNSWGAYDANSYLPPKFTKTSEGIVVLTGLARRIGSIASGGEAIFYLPEGYRPSTKEWHTTMTDPNVGSVIEVDVDGAVTVRAGSAGWLSFDNIKFVPTASALSSTFIAMPLSSGWVNYNAATHQVASYTKDSLNRTITRGMIRSGSTSSNTLITSLSAGYTSPSYLHIPSRTSSGQGLFSPAQTNSTYPGIGIQYKAGNNDYFPIPSMFYNNYSGWITPTMQNGWVWYSSAGIFATPGYIKASDGIVSLKGLITAGTATSGTTMLTLPAGYRPSSRIIHIVQNNSSNSRVDILPNGQVQIMSGGNTWLDLSSINFIAEQ